MLHFMVLLQLCKVQCTSMHVGDNWHILLRTEVTLLSFHPPFLPQSSTLLPDWACADMSAISCKMRIQATRPMSHMVTRKLPRAHSTDRQAHKWAVAKHIAKPAVLQKGLACWSSPLIGRMKVVIGQAKAEAGHVEAQVLLEQCHCRDGPPFPIILHVTKHPAQRLQITEYCDEAASCLCLALGYLNIGDLSRSRSPSSKTTPS